LGLHPSYFFCFLLQGSNSFDSSMVPSNPYPVPPSRDFGSSDHKARGTPTPRRRTVGWGGGKVPGPAGGVRPGHPGQAPPLGPVPSRHSGSVATPSLRSLTVLIPGGGGFCIGRAKRPPPLREGCLAPEPALKPPVLQELAALLRPGLRRFAPVPCTGGGGRGGLLRACLCSGTQRREGVRP